jgi:hypothetical protein
MLRKMGQLAWSIEVAGIVNASPERVMAWWFNPDRKNDFQDRIERTGATDFSLTESTTDGVRVRAATWKDRRGWVHVHRTELHLDPNGMAPRSDDRFIVSASDTVSFQHPRGKKFGLTCTGRIEFVPKNSGSTEIVTIHSHAAAGGTWFQQRSIRRFDLQNGTRQSDEESISRCRAAVSL